MTAALEGGEGTEERLSLKYSSLNPLNVELNPICHSLILLGDLTFMGTCIVSIFQYISNKIQRYTVYLYLETALHVSGDRCILLDIYWNTIRRSPYSPH
jgi:hypothetical protein